MSLRDGVPGALRPQVKRSPRNLPNIDVSMAVMKISSSFKPISGGTSTMKTHLTTASPKWINKLG